MIKYKRRTINQRPELHDKEFVTVEDVFDMVEEIMKAAVKAGANGDKLMEYFSNE